MISAGQEGRRNSSAQQPAQNTYPYPATDDKGSDSDARRQRMEDERAASELENARAQKANIEQMNKAMEDARRKQEMLQGSAARMETEDGGSDRELRDKQQKEKYQKSLMEIARQQKLMEDQARMEMEQASGKMSP